MMGASNPHPHGQIWAGTALPARRGPRGRDPARHLAAHRPAAAPRLRRARRRGGPRVVVENDDWLAVVPFWAAWPYETLLIPRRPPQRLPDLDGPRATASPTILIRAPRRLRPPVRPVVPVLDGLAPGAVPTAATSAHWQLHAHFFPPLLTATVRKFMVGYELLAETQRDLTAEEAAERLRAALGQPAA